MEEQVKKSGAAKGLGIAAFVVAVVGIVISFIPCLGMYGLIPCGIALIIAIIAITIAVRTNSPKGLIIAALIISILGTAIASWQLYVLINAKSYIENDFKDAIEKIDTKSLEDELNNAMNESLDSLGGAINKMQQGLDSVKNN